MSPEDVATRLGWHRSKIYRIEKGESRLILDDLFELLDVYGVRSPRQEALVQLGRDAWKRGWWLAYSDLYAGGSYFVVEDGASKIVFQALHLLPGLFQTREYARALISASHPQSDADSVERRVEARMHRQDLLGRDVPPQIIAILDEAILRRLIGGSETTCAQLHRLIELSGRPNVDLHVVPFSAGAHAGLDGQFTILDFPDEEDPPVAFQEGLFGDVFVEAVQDVGRYTLAADIALDAALPTKESVALIARIAKDIT